MHRYPRGPPRRHHPPTISPFLSLFLRRPSRRLAPAHRRSGLEVPPRAGQERAGVLEGLRGAISIHLERGEDVNGQRKWKMGGGVFF